MNLSDLNLLWYVSVSKQTKYSLFSIICVFAYFSRFRPKKIRKGVRGKKMVILSSGLVKFTQPLFSPCLSLLSLSGCRADREYSYRIEGKKNSKKERMKRVDRKSNGRLCLVRYMYIYIYIKYSKK